METAREWAMMWIVLKKLPVVVHRDTNEMALRGSRGKDRTPRRGKQGAHLMSGLSLVLILLIGRSPDPERDPASLVAKLGAPRYAERERASHSLEDLGRSALPALRAARVHKDPEIRLRASALKARIEGALLTQPSLVDLDFDNARLPDVARSFGEQCGVRLLLLPESSRILSERRVTLREPAPLPFWKALDRLCAAADLQYSLGRNTTPSGSEPSFPLFDGRSRPGAPSVDSGPFRVSIIGLHYQRDVSFLPDAVAMNSRPQRQAEATSTSDRGATHFGVQFYAQVQVAAEPRLALALEGPLRIADAVDDLGNSLTGPSRESLTVKERASGYFGFAGGSVVQSQAVLSRPTRPGTLIRKLRGEVPLLVSARVPDPLVVSLASAQGRVYRNDDVTIIVNEVRDRGEDRLPGIDLTIRPSGAGPRSGAVDASGNELVRPDSYQQQIEILDVQGRSMPWYQSTIDTESGRMLLTLSVPEQAPAASELRFFGLVRSQAIARFDFHDLPLP
jgi:hypothetical protein